MTTATANSATNPFSTRTVIFLVIAGAILALAVLVLSGFGNDINRMTGTGAQGAAPNVRSAQGLYGLEQLINQTGPLPVGKSTRDSDVLQPGLMILTPTIATDPKAMIRIISRRDAHPVAQSDGDPDSDNATNENSNDAARRKARKRPEELPTLIVLPKWQVLPVPFRRDRVRRAGTLAPKQLAKLIPFVKATVGHGGARPLVDREAGIQPFLVPDDPQFLRSDAIEPLISAGEGNIILGKYKYKNLYVLADPDLVDNYALRSKLNARSALAMLSAINPTAPAKVTFDLSLHYGSDELNLLKLLFAPPFLAVTIALIAAAILAGIATANRFGPARREGRAIALGKAALIDNIASLTRLAGRSAQGGARYALATRDRLTRQLRTNRNLSGTALEKQLDRIAPDGAATLETLSRNLGDARTDDELVRAARNLHDWRKDLTK